MITLLQGDNRIVLPTLPEKSVQCVITSPPYFGLRRYDVAGAQIGNEDSPAAYVAALVDVFRLVKRVLREDGCLFVNLGDGYARPAGKGLSGTYNGRNGYADEYAGSSVPPGLKEKDLIGIPWSVAFALRDDGWYLRSAITWCKGNPMPESVRDRPTSATEMIFLLAKQPRYFYDADAIREPAESRDYATWDERKAAGEPVRRGLNAAMRPGNGAGLAPNPAGRNRRNWWVVNSQPYAGSHFATFPEKLIEPMVLAGSSPRACEVCGAPWERATHDPYKGQKGSLASDDGTDPNGVGSLRDESGKLHWGDHHPSKSAKWWTTRETTGWRPTCAHANDGAARCVVLDPFAGSGTTLRVAERYGRDSIGIDLGYLALAEKRTDGIQIDMESLL